MSIVVQPSVQTPWFDDPGAARLLHLAQSHGAILLTCAETHDHSLTGDSVCDEHFLVVSFRGEYEADVVYDSEIGHWQLIATTLDGSYDAGWTVADEITRAFVIEKAARLTQELNKVIARQAKSDTGNAITDEIVTFMGDAGFTNADMATVLGVSHGMFVARLNGSSPWSAVDLLRIYRVAGEHRTEALSRLFSALEGVAA